MSAKTERLMSPEVEDIWKKYFPNIKTVFYKETLLRGSYLSVADAIENLEVYDDDIWICGFPKSGTSWTEELVWNIANDLNFEAAKAAPLDERVLLLERSLVGITQNDETDQSLPAHFKDSIAFAKNLPRPRFIKTHLPYRLLPRQLRTNEKKAKIIYVWRNPKDVCISQYHFAKWNKSYIGDLTSLCKLYLNDAAIYMPFWNHVIEFWNRRNEERILILKYEDMKTDLSSIIRKTANFFNKNFDDEQILKLEEHLNFSSMSKNTSVNFERTAKLRNFGPDGKFMRKGEANQWKSEMSSEMIAQFDAWIQENLKDNESLLRELS